MLVGDVPFFGVPFFQQKINFEVPLHGTDFDHRF